MNPQRFRKKPVVIEAMQWLGRHEDRPIMRAFLNNSVHPGGVLLLQPDGSLLIPTLEGDMRANVGDWVIRGVKGEYYPCKPDIFEATYEAVTP